MLQRGVGTLQYCSTLGESSACQVPIGAVAAWWFDNPHQKVVPRSRIHRSTSHLSYIMRCDAKHSAFVNRRLLTTFYGFPSVAEQGHIRESWMSRVKHPMLRLSQNVTSQPTCWYDYHATRRDASATGSGGGRGEKQVSRKHWFTNNELS